MAKEVKNVEWIGNVRRTTFTDDSSVDELMKKAKIVDGKILKTVENANATKSCIMNVQLVDENGEPVKNPFSSLVYKNALESDKWGEDGHPYVEGADVRIFLSRAEDKNGEIKTYSRIELPPLTTANDALSADDWDELEKVAESADAEAVSA